MGNKKSMTPEKKREINRVIAEELGLKYTKSPFIHGQKIVLANPEKVYVIGKPPHLFNPVDSISDAFKAVDVICPETTIIVIEPAVDLGRGWKAVEIQIPKCGRWKVYYGYAKTPEAAISLTLVQYIKEK